MAHATTSGSKRKGGKANRPGGLGGPGGRGGHRWSTTQIPARELPAGLLARKPHEIAAAVKRDAERETQSAATPYRTAMTTLAAYANRHSKSMLPERRKKLAQAKDELRALFDRPHEGKGVGGPGKKKARPKARSRRNRGAR